MKENVGFTILIEKIHLGFSSVFLCIWEERRKKRKKKKNPSSFILFPIG